MYPAREVPLFSCSIRNSLFNISPRQAYLLCLVSTDSKIKVPLEFLAYLCKSSENDWALISSNYFSIDLNPYACYFLKIPQHFWSIHVGTISEIGLQMEKNFQMRFQQRRKVKPLLKDLLWEY